MNKHNYIEASSSTDSQRQKREEIFNLFSTIKNDIAISNPGLILTSPMLAKVLSLANVYKRISKIPGDILEFGVWYGQNLILLENLRSILEPFNINRRFFGFDTFNGYPENDSSGFSGSYKLSKNDLNIITSLFQLHQQSNTPSHIDDKIKLISGDIRQTLLTFNLSSLALVLLDVSDEETCKLIFDKIIPRMPSKSILLIDDLTNKYQPDIEKVYKPYIDLFELETCPFFPTRTIAIRK